MNMRDRLESIGPKLSQLTASMPLILVGGLLLGSTPLVAALPPPSDVPEEILRTEIITQARSPVDGTALTPGEYAALLEDPTFRGTSAPTEGSGSTAIAPFSPEQTIINRWPVRELLRSIFPF